MDIESNTDISNTDISNTEISDYNLDLNKAVKSEESLKRSCVKSVVWRCVAVSTTMAISYFLVGDMETAGKLGALDMSIKLIAHFGYERLWSKISWGYIHK